jgi:hypothetical protein
MACLGQTYRCLGFLYSVPFKLPVLNCGKSLVTKGDGIIYIRLEGSDETQSKHTIQRVIPLVSSLTQHRNQRCALLRSVAPPTPNLSWICNGYHGYYACTTDNAASALAFYEIFTSILLEIKLKSHKRRYNDIYRLIFSVTTCIGIQSHLSEFRRNLEKQGYM